MSMKRSTSGPTRVAQREPAARRAESDSEQSAAHQLHESPRMAAQRERIAALTAAAQRKPAQLVVQGRFLNGFQIVQSIDSNEAKIVLYCLDQQGINSAEFVGLLQSDKTHGDIKVWAASKLGMSWAEMEKRYQFSRQSQQFPQIANIPFPWIHDTKATTNVGGPSITVVPSPQHTPTSSQEEDRIDRPQPSDMVIDLTAQDYMLKGSVTPIGPEDRSDVRASARLNNEYLQHQGPATLQDPKKLTVPGVVKTKGENEGQDKTVREAANTYTGKERKRKPTLYDGKSVLHHPDSSITGKPSSPMGWHPGSKVANDLEGVMTGVGGSRHPYGSQTTRYVTKEHSGFYAPTLDGRERRKAREQREDQQPEETIRAWVSRHYRRLIDFSPHDSESATGYAFPEVDILQLVLEKFEGRYEFELVYAVAQALQQEGPWGVP
jgi:hypothetical protein